MRSIVKAHFGTVAPNTLVSKKEKWSLKKVQEAAAPFEEVCSSFLPDKNLIVLSFQLPNLLQMSLIGRI